MAFFAGFCLSFCAALLLQNVFAGEDFYELLGVERNANDREIRKAFKKLALIYHPDKNQDDTDAHDKFVKINRAYEVLKNEELRKKYDVYGENGIKEGGAGQNYQSWSFYKNQFGIYDDDPEVITLSKSDFDQSVLHGSDKWFINFYSPHCSHCHDLAPAWRRMARELEGVVRIGAVNCEEEFFLCREQNIYSYPALLVFPEKETYPGPRTQEDLINFVMNRVKSTVVNLMELDGLPAAESDGLPKPVLVDFCPSDSSEECLSSLSRRKVSAVLDGLITVATVNCEKSDKLCNDLDIQAGVFYFAEGIVQKGKGKRMESLDARELAYATLELLPDMVQFTEDQFKKLRKDVSDSLENPWLIQFVGTAVQRNLELRKLPALLKDIRIGRVNCSTTVSLCKDLFIHKHPTFAVFKNNGGYEIHHGRLTAHDVAAFARECARTNLRVLGPNDLKMFSSSDETWFVDFFTPWCPPCMKLLPEFRKAAKVLGSDINFGTVDCTVQLSLCQQVNVHSYPTTILYNQSQPNAFVGLHSVDELVSFVEDVRHPPVIALTDDQFDDLILNRPSDQIWVVDFFAPWCGPCMDMAPEYRKLAKMLKEFDFISVGSIDCTKFQHTCQENYVQAYPTIRVYPTNGHNFADYNSWFRDAFNMRTWVYQFIPSAVEEIGGNAFYEILNSEEPWMIDFFAPWCGHCQVFAPEFEKVAKEFEGHLKCGKMNCDIHPQACQRAGVRGYPSVKFYSGAKKGRTQSAYGFDINSQDAKYIISFLHGQLGLGEKQKLKIESAHARDEL